MLLFMNKFGKFEFMGRGIAMNSLTFNYAILTSIKCYYAHYAKRVMRYIPKEDLSACPNTVQA